MWKRIYCCHRNNSQHTKLLKWKCKWPDLVPLKPLIFVISVFLRERKETPTYVQGKQPALRSPPYYISSFCLSLRRVARPGKSYKTTKENGKVRLQMQARSITSDEPIGKRNKIKKICYAMVSGVAQGLNVRLQLVIFFFNLVCGFSFCDGC